MACTVEMTDVERDIEVAIIDEIQMLRDTQRGWAWLRAFLGEYKSQLFILCVRVACFVCCHVQLWLNVFFYGCAFSYDKIFLWLYSYMVTLLCYDCTVLWLQISMINLFYGYMF